MNSYAQKYVSGEKEILGVSMIPASIAAVADLSNSLFYRFALAFL